MNFKVFATFFTALLAIHVSSQTPIKDDSIKQIVVQVLNEVLNVTENLLVKANEIADDVEANQVEVKDKIVAFVVEEEVKLNADIIKLIDELKDGATDDGKAVVACIEAEQSSTDTAFATQAGLVGNCLVGEVKVVLPEVRTILSQLNDLQVDVQGQTDTLSACSDDELTCLVSFLTTIIETAQKIPPIVEQDLADVEALIKTVVADVDKCDLLPGIKQAVQDVFNEAVVCIKK